MIVRPEERIIVALDVNNFHDLHVLLQKLRGTPIWGVKLGLELCTAVGAPAAVAMATGYGYRVMLDLKFGDIPNTMAGAARSAANLGVEMFTIHASAGRESIAAAVNNCGNAKVLGVTVLTSIDDTECRATFGDSTDVVVRTLAHHAVEKGGHGVVCSPKELALLRSDTGLSQLKFVVPGIRPEWAAVGDQRRVMTPGDAVCAGATHLVIGRPITQPPEGISPQEAVQRIIDEITGAVQT